MNTKDKGNVSEISILKRLTQKGYRVSIPWGENTPYDLIVEIEENLYRIQCRTGRVKNGKSLCFNLSSTCYSSMAKKSIKKIRSKEIDFYGIYNPENDSCYLIHKDKIISNNECRLRLTPFEKGREWMANKSLWAKDFLI
jgi:PD-(D/E)XK endonuclease